MVKNLQSSSQSLYFGTAKFLQLNIVSTTILRKFVFFRGFFHPPGYIVTAQARKPKDEKKNSYMKKFDFNALVNRHLTN